MQRSGAASELEELAARHRAGLVAFAATIAPPGRADDVVQDALLRAYLALQRGDRPESPKAWLYAIVRNTALNERRGWRPHEQLDETIDGVEQPPDAAERRRRFGGLVDGLRGLPASQRDALVQRELEGRGHEEIASRLGVSSAAVRQLIFRARTSLRAGVGALVPTSLLRLVSLPGVAETGAGGGLGPTVAKIGVGAALATGAVVGGVGLDAGERAPGGEGSAGPVALAPEGASASTGRPYSGSPPEGEAGGEQSERGGGGERGGERAGERGAGRAPGHELAGRPPAPHQPRPMAHHRSPRTADAGGETGGARDAHRGGGATAPAGDATGTAGGSGASTGSAPGMGEQPAPPPA